MLYRQLSNLISFLFHPLLMATFLFGIMLFLIPSSLGTILNNRIKWLLLLVILLTTFVLPVISLFVMKMTSGISSFKLAQKDERIVPFLLISVFYGVSAYLMAMKLNINPLVNVIFLIMATMVLMVTLITIFWKISAHAIGVGGVLGFLLSLNMKYPDNLFFWPVILWIFFTGFTLSSRLYLNAHRPLEVYMGVLFGFGFCFSGIYVFA